MQDVKYTVSMSKKRKKMGRPPLPENKRRGASITLRVTARERARLKAEAKRQGVSVSDVLMRPWREE